jgi:hypothetical protein
MVNKLQAVAAIMGDHAKDNPDEAEEEGGGLWNVLPIIVAVGGQSAGKSSVIEAVVGQEILPRGSGICTRRPLVLQMLCCPESEGETATFVHTGKRVFDFSKSADTIREEIENETTRSLANSRSIVSKNPIFLTMKAHYLPNLTLVDMPGLTKIATDGQDPAIVRDLQEMSEYYIKNGATASRCPSAQPPALPTRSSLPRLTDAGRRRQCDHPGRVARERGHCNLRRDDACQEVRPRRRAHAGRDHEAGPDGRGHRRARPAGEQAAVPEARLDRRGEPQPG